MIRSVAKLLLSPQQRRAVLHALSHIPVLNRRPPFDHIRWTREEYTRFARERHQFIFMSIARFAHINRPIRGYYMEFGCNEGNTMRMAWDAFHGLFDWTFLAFDSFEGLPEMEDFDKSSIFKAGALKMPEDDFVRTVLRHGIPRERLRTFKGFYDESLTPSLRERLLPQKAAVVYVDCDLYKSTVPVLRFARDFLQIGTVIVFDDWNCYHARPDHGERRAWAEFLAEFPDLAFEPFVTTGEAASFICVKC